jgi:RNA polymerase sigma-70 factor (ECF subfamily)
MDDEMKLIEQARAGSEEAFSILLRQHQAHVRAYLGRYSRNSDVVDDLAQETFFSAYRSLATYKGEAPIRIWLLGIARHRVLRYLRDEERRRAREGRGLESVVAGWMADRVEPGVTGGSRHEYELSALRTCIKSLPVKSASIVANYYFKSQAAARISQQTGQREGTIWMTLFRIREALRQCVQTKLTATGANS